jgi:hypothetical protein
MHEPVHEKERYIENIENVICYRAFLFLLSGDGLFVFYISEENFREIVFIMFSVSIFGIIIS